MSIYALPFPTRGIDKISRKEIVEIFMLAAKSQPGFYDEHDVPIDLRWPYKRSNKTPMDEARCLFLRLWPTIPNGVKLSFLQVQMQRGMDYMWKCFDAFGSAGFPLAFDEEDDPYLTVVDAVAAVQDAIKRLQESGL